MGKTWERIVAWLLIIVMVLIMAVGSGRVTLAAPEDGETETTTVTATVNVVDSDNTAVSGATVNATTADDSGETVSGSEDTENPGSYSLQLVLGTTYTFFVSGMDDYKDASESFTPSEDNTSCTITVSSKDTQEVSVMQDGTAVTDVSVDYGSTTGTYTVSGEGTLSVSSADQNVATVSVDADAGTFTLTGVEAGTTALTVSRAATEDYLEGETTINVTVNQVAQGELTVMDSDNNTLDSISTTYGSESEYAVSGQGLLTVSSSDESVMTVEADGGRNPNKFTLNAVLPGTATLTIKRTQAGSYQDAETTIRVTVEKATLTVELEASAKTYDGTTDAADCVTVKSVSGGMEGDNVTTGSIVVESATFAGRDVGTGIVITYKLGLANNALADRYEMECNSVLTADITGKTLTVTVSAGNKYYDGSALDCEVTSISENVNHLTAESVVVSTGDEMVGTKNFTVSWAADVSGTIQNNYTLVLAGTTSAEIRAIPLAVDVSVNNKQYDGTTDGTLNKDECRVSVSTDAAEAVTYDAGTLTDNVLKYITVSDITFCQVDVGNGLTVTYRLSWTEEAETAGYEDIFALPEADEDGTYSTTASITAREVVINSVNLADRIYNGTETVDIDTSDGNKAVVILSAAQRTDSTTLSAQVAALYLTGTVTVDSANAGTRMAESFEEVKLATADSSVKTLNFTLVVDSDGKTDDDLDGYFDDNTVRVTISRAIIYLQFSDLTYTYDTVPDGIDKVTTTWLSETETGDVVNVSITDYTFEGTATDSLKSEARSVLQENGAALSLDLTQNTLDDDGDALNPGLDIRDSYKNVIGLTGLTEVGSSLEVGTNYRIQVKSASHFGSITIEQDDSMYDIVDISAAGSVYVTGSTLYVKSGATFMADQVVDSTAVIYDEVWIGTGSNGSVTLKTNLTEGVTIDTLVSAGSEEEVTLYLAKDGKNLSQGFTITLHNDGTVPSATFRISEETLDSQDFAGSVTFGVIDNKTVTVGLSVKDTESGIASIETYLYTGSKDEMDMLDGQSDDLDTLSAEWNWEEAHGFTKGAGSCTVSSVYTVKSSTYAVIFARVTDAVGNVSIYGSNGLVVEAVMPNVPIIIYSTAKNYGNGVYNGNVSVTIQASENLTSTEAVASGLQSVTYTIYKDGKAMDDYTDVELFDDTLEPAMEDGTVTVTELQSAASMSLKKTITIPARVFNSNNVYVAVHVTDQAGNTSKATGSTIQIDVTDPTVEVTYNNNHAVNTRYFKKARKMTIVCTERNFDIRNVIFDLTLEDGTKRTLNFSELSALDGISTSYAASKNDSQYGRSTTKYTDARINTMTITFSGDNDYTIVPHFGDLAGNEPEKVTYDTSTAKGTKTHFIIDTTAPTISITYYDTDGNVITPGKSEKKRLYEDGTVRAVVTITEHNFAGGSKFVDGQMTYTVTAVDADGETVSVSDYQKTANTLSGWTQNTDAWTSTRFRFSTDANYVAGFTYTDLAGNSVTWKNDYYTVDQTAPTGTVKVGNLGTWSTFLSRIPFGLFSRKSQTVKITADDVTTPVSSISYLISASRMTKTQLAASTAWKKYSSFSRSPDQQFIVYAKLVDKAGNVTYLSSDGVVLDTTEPAPVITITVNDAGDGIYSGDVPFTVEVTDPTSGGTYAGLQSVSYEILCDGEVTQSGNFDSGLTLASGRVQSLTRNLTVDAVRNNSNNVTICVTAVDNAGNTATAEKKLKIDITEPIVTVTWNDVSAVNSTYYNETRVATVTVTERNFDEADVRFSITNTDGTQPSISGWSHSANSGMSDSAAHICTVTFSADGDYTFTMEVTDLADNTGSYGQMDSFTVDQTDPVISVSYDNNDVTGGIYYKAARTATVTIREHNFDATAVTAAIKASLNGQDITAPALSSFRHNGDEHTATISYAADADYTFSISCTDLAGNSMVDHETERFTVDTRKPEIVIGNIRKANTGTVQPTIEVTDQNYEDTQVTITLTGVHNGIMDVAVSAASVRLGQLFTLQDLAHEQALDDIYTLQVTATDQAGNTAENSYIFSVNRFGSVYTLDGRTAELLESFYINEPADLVIRETNPDRLDEYWIVCTKDGENYTLEEGIHYTVNVSGEDGSWWMYEYTVGRDNFMEDGFYMLTMYSQDGASNTSSNQAEGMIMEFVVDTTPPSIVVTGLTDRGQYTQDVKNITVNAQDNMYLAALKLEVLADDGSLLEKKEYTEEEISENYGTVSYELASRSVWQTVRVTATDAAGNQAVSEEITVLIHPSMLLQYYMNNLLFYASLALLLLLAVFIGCYVRRKRKF